MKTMNKIFEKYGRWLGYRDAVRFEREMVKAIDKIIKTATKEEQFQAFKTVITKYTRMDVDDSATGMMQLGSAFNRLLASSLEDEDIRKAAWSWLFPKWMEDSDVFYTTILSAYPDKQDQLMSFLSGRGALDRYGRPNGKGVMTPSKIVEAMYTHGWAYYKAYYMKVIGDPGLEKYLDQNLRMTECKQMKVEFLLERGEREKAFDLIKDDDQLVLDAAELLGGATKEIFLLNWITDGESRFVGQRKSWLDKLYEVCGNKYDEALSGADRLNATFNQKLYELERYEELFARIEAGKLSDFNVHKEGLYLLRDQYNAIQEFKKLKGIYPEKCGHIMIDYAVAMMEKNVNRQSYKMSAATMVRAGKLCDECRETAERVAAELVEQHPTRYAMIEEFKNAGLV